MNSPESRTRFPQSSRTAWLLWTSSLAAGPFAMVLFVLLVNLGNVPRSRASLVILAWYGGLFVNWLASIALALQMTADRSPLRRILPLLVLALALMLGGFAVYSGISFLGCALVDSATR